MTDAGRAGDGLQLRDVVDESLTRKDDDGGLQILDSRSPTFSWVAIEVGNAEEQVEMVPVDHRVMAALLTAAV